MPVHQMIDVADDDPVTWFVSPHGSVILGNSVGSFRFRTVESFDRCMEVIAGQCPECKRVVVVFNSHEVWPLVRCSCGWAGGTTDIDNHTRLERDGVVLR